MKEVEKKSFISLGDVFSFPIMGTHPQVKVTLVMYRGNCKAKVIDKESEYFGETLTLTYDEAVKAKKENIKS